MLVALLLISSLARADAWSDALARAQREQKPIVVFYRTADCPKCDAFERTAVSHPIIQRRLPAVVFLTLPTVARPNVAYFDPNGTLQFRWPIIPDTINFGVILDTVVFGRAAGSLAAAPDDAVIRILPLARQVVSGRNLVQTRIGTSSIARVTFSLDGREITRARVPFSAVLDFGVVPERHTIGVVAFDRRGKELGRATRVVNEGGETFWLHLVEPREEFVNGPTRVSVDLRVPPANRVQRVVISWNDAERAVLTSPPWKTTVKIPENEVGFVRAVAELDDGRTSEDAMLLNASAFESNVQLVQLPITIFGSYTSIAVREGKKERRVESIATASETPLTVGLLIDASDSMEATLPDLQETAIRFLDTVLGPRDRAFVISFETRAHLLQPATKDATLLRQSIMRIRPEGLTSLYDAMALGLLQFEGVKGRRAMVVFTDGLDRTSEYEANEVGDLARRVSVPVHVIGSSEEPVKRVAEMTGGTSQMLERLDDLPSIFARIEAALRAQVLAFIRIEPAKKENEWHAVQVEVKGDGLQVYAPAGYYAGW